MVEIFKVLLADSFFNTGISIKPFNIPHIVYLLLIFGFIVGSYFLLRNKSEEFKTGFLKILVIALTFSYLSDFFTHIYVYPDMGGLNYDKLPFHICTALCPLSCYAQFGKYGEKIKAPVAFLGIAAPLMYLCYPASVGTGEPWCYQAVQTMFFHGVLLAWSVCNVVFGFVKAEIKKVWKCGVLLGAITLWAKFGNLVYAEKGVSWFFLEEDAFYIGLVANGIIPKWSLMIINPVVFFLAILAIYGVCILVGHLTSKGKKTPDEQEKAEEKVLENA